MKSFIVALVIVGVAVTVGTIIYLDRQKVPSPPAPVAESSPQRAEPTQLGKIVAAKSESPQTISTNTNEPAPVSVSTAAENETNSDSAASSIHKMVDALLAAKNGEEKHNLFQQLIKSGQIDAAIAELKTRAAQDTSNAEVPTTLGEAQLNELRAMRDSGNNDYSAIGILAMQADQSFNAALKIDPQNWEAQFVKNASMFYWPANPEMDNQVVQNLSKLIDQQETVPAQPQFAQTYVVLGNEYQKIGQPDKAQATWQIGLTKFPNDSALQKKISGQ